MIFFKNRSLSFKLLVLFLLTAFAIVIALRFSSGSTFVKHMENSIRPHLSQYFYYINQEIGDPPNIEIAQQLSKTLNLKIMIQGPEINWSSDNTFPVLDDSRLTLHQGESGNYENGKQHKSFIFRFSNPQFKTTFFTQTDRTPPPMGKLLFILLSVLTLLYFLLRRVLSPLKGIQQSVKKICSGELSHRIVTNRKDEFGDLSKEINAMADDVENMLEAKRQLLLAISHELRSPITRAKVALSLMDDKKLKEGLENDLGEMETMISGLLEAETLNHRHQILNLENTNINSLVSEVVGKFYPEENIKQALCDTHTDIPIDDARIRFTIKNLISNALKHRKQKDDEVVIITEKTDSEVKIKVIDNGVGIPEKHLAHITEPFYRVDPSRQRETGGYGLGLYIIDKIINAHHGVMRIESKENEGTEVVISLPLSQ